MKRPRDSAQSQTLDSEHPIVAFHREAWIGDYWHVIRETFRTEYEELFEQGVKLVPGSTVTYKNTIEEPKKFWRHCREALAKWVLSQTARYRPLLRKEREGEACDVAVDYDAVSEVRFLPSYAMLSSADFDVPPQEDSIEGVKGFDEQLIRDLTFKSTALVRNDATFINAVAAFVQSFGLAKRCAQAVSEIEGHINAAMNAEGGLVSENHNAAPVLRNPREQGHRRAEAPSCSWLRPLVRRIREEDKTSPAQLRIHGPLMEIGVTWPTGYVTDAAIGSDSRYLSRSSTNVRPVVIPEASWLRLRRCYAAFGAVRDAARYHISEEGSLTVTPEQVLDAYADLRCAAVVLRYEHCLASGSLQLCADSALKVALNRQGYNVMDLCASPINAYMVKLDTPDGGDDKEGGIAPRRFCSAFWDTDRYFGSMGSALMFSAEATYRKFRGEDDALLSQWPAFRVETTPLHPEPADAPLLLTLDVPYDEDLCELLFLKLAKDCVAAASTPLPRPAGGPAWVDYLLVLPLWWNVPLDQRRCPKLFVAQEGGQGNDEGKDGMWALVKKHADYLNEGKRIPYAWLEALPAAMVVEGEAKDNQSPPYLAVFDGVFIRDSYTYFCTATNKPLSGVTATEVIGVSLQSVQSKDLGRTTEGGQGHPTAASMLQRSLFDFYAVSPR